MAAREPGLEEYVGAIESLLGRARGRDFALAPPDFQLARGWFHAGLPLAAVLDGIADALRGERPPGSLLACRRAVERAAGAFRQAPQAPAGSAPGAPGGLARLAERLLDLSREQPGFAGVAGEARALAGVALTDPEQLAALQTRVRAAALLALDASERGSYARGAERALERQAARLPAVARAAALERYVVRRALERFGLVDLV